MQKTYNNSFDTFNDTFIILSSRKYLNEIKWNSSIFAQYTSKAKPEVWFSTLSATFRSEDLLEDLDLIKWSNFNFNMFFLYTYIFYKLLVKYTQFSMIWRILTSKKLLHMLLSMSSMHSYLKHSQYSLIWRVLTSKKLLPHSDHLEDPALLKI